MDHIRHRSSIPRAWVVNGLAMGPGPDAIYREAHWSPSQYTCGICHKYHCEHRCASPYWCHECDGPDCGGGCYDDKTCPKRIRVLTEKRPGYEIWPDEWRKR
jgi:hypothetical protein